ncbi:hypothetical protein JFL47_11575 [Haemophilus haemoglobinophilus]|nr:hypothetical protein [Canicola haemoglobinophilus]MBN6711854.1 hypothetical protein [Canicola haemoglobinophilus]
MNEFKNIKICDECGSEYFAESSKMSDLCPDCSHYLYGYENCNHKFENGRCIYCYWNGFSSDFINKNFKDTSYMNNLKQSLLNLIKYLSDENIIVNVDIDLLTNKNFYESVLFLKNIFKEQYPNTKLKPVMKRIHYANRFENEDLKQSAYLLDDIEQYLTVNKFLNHDSGVEFFNKKITKNIL